jgi:hypothetical protein
MAELRGKHPGQTLRHHRAELGDSPLAEATENGTLFDKVIELQATTSSVKPKPKWQERPHNGWQGLPAVVVAARKLFSPRVRGLVLLNLVSSQSS